MTVYERQSLRLSGRVEFFNCERIWGGEEKKPCSLWLLSLAVPSPPFQISILWHLPPPPIVLVVQQLQTVILGELSEKWQVANVT